MFGIDAWQCGCRIEIKSFSITRLKPFSAAESRSSSFICWNQKFLDYEIETISNSWHICPVGWSYVGIKSFSITRLKLGWGGLIWAVIYYKSWNQKFLDYEIETLSRITIECHDFSWNQKFLDYEIETGVQLPKNILLLCWNQKFLDYEIETLPQ